MRDTNALVSVGLPVRNGAERIEGAVKSVLAQDHENLELVICDNASTDDTEELCRALAAQDTRIVYHRHPVNVGLHNNFLNTLELATGRYFRWLGDDDWLAPHCISRGLEPFAADDGLILVTNQFEYTDPEGRTETEAYNGTGLGSDCPITRFTEYLRLLNESRLQIDPEYGLYLREPLTRIERRNMLSEDQVFATKVALAGRWAHVPEILGRRNWRGDTHADLVRKLGLPSWQVHFATALQCVEMLRWLDKCDLDERQRRRARVAIARFYVRRQQGTVSRRSRKLAHVARAAIRHRRTRTLRSVASAPTASDASKAAAPEGI
jgi:glycosyltransferase involved in cell wall biosynthesis